MRLKNRIISNIFLVLCSVTVTLVIADILLGKWNDTLYMGEKTYIQKGDQWGNCYPAVTETHLPIRMVDPNTGQDASCIIYDRDKRRKGFFPTREETVALIGDSFTFGEGIGEQDTLGYRLGLGFPQYNFINLGQPGTDITYTYQTLNYLLKRRQDIKHIIYFYNINDVLINDKIANQQKFIIDFQNVRWSNVRKKNRPLIMRWLLKSNIVRLIERTAILRKESALTVQNYLDMYNPSLNKVELEKTVMLLNAMNKAAQEKNVQLIVIMYPLLHKNSIGLYPFTPIHKLMQKICSQYQIPFIDAYPAFAHVRSFEKYIVHPLDYHPNGRANALVVDYLKQLNAQHPIFEPF